MNNNQPFHLVSTSPWPFLLSISTLSLMMSILMWFNMFLSTPLVFNLLTSSIITFIWWKDIARESTFQGSHPSFVVTGLRWGMILFITSEFLFFSSFFWTFFHSSLSPNINLGMMWPPKNISTLNPTQMPLLNTIILLSSGTSITWAHHSILNSNFNESKISISMTVILGMTFTFLQVLEYLESSFSMSDSIYGSTFFVSTGFHGIHVIIGTVFIMHNTYRLFKMNFSYNHHFGFEAASWYWHFVDVVWLFLFTMIYWWGS
uniref:Cytochrome c oxidase subunit 3 n=1 Tax=Aposthonia borneensis TaxID=1208762 RepID=A0A678PAH0_9NEOP|nr:cytochrome c oxidase subunit III [Aposthonia borneensis]